MTEMDRPDYISPEAWRLATTCVDLFRAHLVDDQRVTIAMALDAKYGSPMNDWKSKPQTDLEKAIREFKAALPGWWYSVCECQVSCDASCAPTTESEHINLIREAGDPFDSGFHADLRQPSTLAEALRNVMRQALEEIAIRSRT